MAVRNLLQAIHDALEEEMRADETVLILGEDVGRAGGVFRVTEGLQEEFGPDRALDTPLAESLIVGSAIGLSVNGMRPVAEIQFADFIPPAFDQIVSEAARFYYRSNGAWNVPITIRAPYGVVPGGALYHSQSVEAYFCNTPGLKVVAPTFPKEAKGLLKSAIRDPNPVLFFEHKRCYRLLKEDVPEEDYTVPIGEAKIHREGEDITVVAYGLVLHTALEVAKKLSEEHGIEAEVVEPLTLYPLDRETILASARKTGKFLAISEANITGSVTAEMAALVAREAFEWLDAPVMRLGAPDIPAAAFARPMMDAFVPDAARIESAMLELARY
ncbi:MAG: alpha-ketoacid dehydrogenase subunit beta [Rubrobacteraceae bacterium]|uniref:alpha-ketoacid dehydrogenase subunit beta n=1 Tax=Rubrobacter naiadicus TaxID=1392641 RepID=UPI00236290AF|nr:alpha-ketoacid dehydrogenase subunit beta [Rubrobacter naiadicus]MBX6762552.1 alpha-ketoacid dehydrogenase subunit beta [Rubrobacteraceae bacterium]MCL6439338.1 alpha-ketoacid dehydrogenase subunit beta [Rubrobacteraceae bacterium]